METYLEMFWTSCLHIKFKVKNVTTDILLLIFNV